MASVVVRSRNGYKVVDVRDLIVDDKENIRKGETVRVGSANFSGTVEGVFASKPKAEEYVKTVKAKPGDKDPELPAKGRKRSFKEIVQDNNADYKEEKDEDGHSRKSTTKKIEIQIKENEEPDLEPPSKQEKKHEGNNNNAREDLEQSGDSEEEPEFTCSLEFLFPGTEQKPEDSSEGSVSYEESEDSTEEFVSYEDLEQSGDSEEEPEFTCFLEFLFPGTEEKPDHEDSSEGSVSYEESEDSTEEFVSYAKELVSQDDSYDPDDERNAVIDYPDSQELWASDDYRENIYGFGEWSSDDSQDGEGER